MATSSYTSFDLTPDSGGTQSATSDLGNTTLEGLDRYSGASLTGTYSYPQTDQVDGFYIPMMYFTFYSAKGQTIGSAPTVKLRVPNNFNITNFSEYSRTENIFGAGAQNIYEQASAEKVGSSGLSTEDLADPYLAARYGASASEAFLYSVRRALGGVSGFIQSGGLNALAQYEFEQRAAVNPYAQLLYKGPQFRRYQIPVSIRPRNAAESKAALDIVKIFKVASSPTVQNRVVDLGGGPTTLQSFSFGYPHLTQFDIKFNVNGANQDIFKSKLCAIESVAVDYGGQKMVFFEDGVPTDITLTLQLTEVAVRTLGDARNDSVSQRTIL